MAEQSPLFETALCSTAADFRRMIGGLVCQEGVADGDDLLVTTGGSGLDVSVAAGQAFIQGDDLADQGMYEVGNNGPVTLTATTADGTNPRIDTVVATVRDSDYGGADNDWILQILPGTPTPGANLTNLSGAATPIPNNTIVLAYVLVATGDVGPLDAADVLDARDRFVACGEPGAIYSSRAYRTSNLNISDSSPTALNTWQAFDGSALPNPYFSYSGGIFTILRNGFYRVEAYTSWANNATGARRTGILFTVAMDKYITVPAAGNGLNNNQSVAVTEYLTKGETVQVEVGQWSGGSLAIQGGTSFRVTRLGVLAP